MPRRVRIVAAGYPMHVMLRVIDRAEKGPGSIIAASNE
jgi:hypothetical protein